MDCFFNGFGVWIVTIRMAENCIFCKIVKGEAPAQKIWEDAEYLAILSIFPNTPGFTVVMPKQHLPSYLFNLPDGELQKLVVAAKKVGKLLDASFEDVGRTGLIFEGFGVDHAHAKLFPMHGTGDLENWKPIEHSQRVFFDQYPGFISSHDYKRADDAQLAKIADKIRATAKKMGL